MLLESGTSASCVVMCREVYVSQASHLICQQMLYSSW